MARQPNQPNTTSQLQRLRANAETAAETPRARKPKVIQHASDDDDDMDAGFEAAPVRRSARRPARDANRETVQNTRRGAVVVEGRGGEVLTRRRTELGDPYHVPPAEIPDGWSYQWNPVTVLNQEVTRIQNLHFANGWRPVPADRHPGRWTKPGDTGDVVVDGLRLEERPEVMTDEANREGEMKAKQQIRDQAESLRLTDKKLPKGFESRQKYRGTGANVSISIDKSFEVPPAEHQLADDND